MYKVILSHGAVMPTRAHRFDSGMDLRAKGISEVIDNKLQKPVWFDDDKKEYILMPGQRVLVKTGIQIQQLGTVSHYTDSMEFLDIQVRPRSGLALKQGIGMVNSVGTIDKSYTGDIGVILINLGDADFIINDNDRVAQMIISKVTIPNPDLFKIVDSFDESENDRSSSGFGSSGVK